MDKHNHSMNALFEQLGLGSSNLEIETFIKRNTPLPATINLHKAKIWNVSQAAFLDQAIVDDADWVVVVDQLNARLRFIAV